MNLPVVRHSIETLLNLKAEYFAHISAVDSGIKGLDMVFDQILWHSPLRLDKRYGTWCEDSAEKYMDQSLWRYLVKLFDLKKYMLATEFEKLQKQIEEFKFPVFTLENAYAWMDGLKGLILENVNTLVKQVYENIVNGHYYTGNRERKKRNNAQIDKTFILYTWDYRAIFGYSFDRPTITDDLEKVCYLLDGEKVPEITLKSWMRNEKKATAENKYMKIIVRQNGNTQFTLDDGIRRKLNELGPDGRTIGQELKIKVFE